MSNIAIRVENLGKMYRVGGPQERYQTFRTALTRTVSVPLRRARELLRGMAASDLSQEFWALKEVSFDVEHGEVIGIIGRNGAGKSTLLKLLSRITEPTAGSIDVYGRIGALLEVGTGFHPELTGRENVYLNGAILGMSRKEIDRKFDEIIDFAGVERFIDTPVKHYSSGMGLRLGFAVAAYLEPDILVVDEVLAVGDAEFQKKCLGKMSDVASEGRTVLFVSHNMGVVRSLCGTGMVFDYGHLSFVGDISSALQTYQQLRKSATDNEGAIQKSVKFTNLRINGSSGTSIDTTFPFAIAFDLQLGEKFTGYSLYFILMDADGRNVIHSRIESFYVKAPIDVGIYHVSVQGPALWLRPGIYSLQLKLIANKIGMTARYISDTEYVDVVGNSDPVAMHGYLSPQLIWDFSKPNYGNHN